MNIELYRVSHPAVKHLPCSGLHIVEEGMLQFDETAYAFAGPYEGNFVYFCIRDDRENNKNLKSIKEEQQKFRFLPWTLPIRLRTCFKTPAKSEKQLQKRLSLLTQKEYKKWLDDQKSFVIDYPTIEKPFILFLAGNDDVSYSKFFPTIEEVRKELLMLMENQPLNFFLHVEENGFCFTN